MNKKTIHLAFLIFAFSSFSGLNAQTTERPWINYISMIHGKKYKAPLSRAELLSSPDWNPAEAIPVSHQTAINLSRTELERNVSSIKNWKVTRIELISAFHGHHRGTVPSKDEPFRNKWIFVVRYSPGEDASSSKSYIQIPITLSGNVVQLQEDQ